MALGTQPDANFIVNGSTTTTTLVWGTKNYLTTPTGTGAQAVLVKSARPSMMVEEVKIPTFDGRTGYHILLVDGAETEFTCVDDSGITWPAVGATVTCLDPVLGSQSFRVTAAGYNLAVKTEGEKVVTAKYFNSLRAA